MWRATNWIVGVCLLVGCLGWSESALAGWVVEQFMKGGAEGGRQQVLIQANRMKTIMLGPDGRPAAAFILDLDAQTITHVDYRQRQVMTATVQEYVQAIQGAQQVAMREMQERLKSMPPQERQMAEQMMRSQTGQPGGTGQDCREPQTEVRRTGQQATIAGYPAVRYDVLADGKLEAEVWAAPAITAWRELDPPKLERFTAEIAKLVGCGPGRPGLLGADASWKLASEGYPVRTIHPGAVTIEVVKAESRTIPAPEFQPPPGFARRTLQQMILLPPPEVKSFPPR
jgi:hypothetical protein